MVLLPSHYSFMPFNEALFSQGAFLISFIWEKLYRFFLKHMTHNFYLEIDPAHTPHPNLDFLES